LTERSKEEEMVYDDSGFEWFDSNMDSRVDLGAADTTGDGMWDTVAMNGNGDGFTVGWMWDTVGNGELDTVAFDWDADGRWDFIAWDVNHDGLLDLGGDGLGNHWALDYSGGFGGGVVVIGGTGNTLIGQGLIDYASGRGAIDVVGALTGPSGWQADPGDVVTAVTNSVLLNSPSISGYGTLVDNTFRTLDL
jgi:hypothetical protein